MSLTKSQWWHTEHDADIGLRAIASSRELLFAAMGQALTAVVTDPATVASKETVTISCEAPDDAMLLVDWLNALIYEMATRHLVFGSWNVELVDTTLRAVVGGERLDRDKHKPVVEVKGATLTELSVAQDDQGDWSGHCVVDV